MEDLPEVYASYPMDQSIGESFPGAEYGVGDDVAVVGAYDMDDPQLLLSPFAQAPAFDEASMEEPVPMGVEEVEPTTTTEAVAAVPVKRKRGRPPKKHGGGDRASAAAKRRKEEEEESVCFICFDGGNLVVCDRRGCQKVYHPACINRDEAFFRSRARWNCGWHICSMCGKTASFLCYTCTYSLCKSCIRGARFFCIRGNKGLCETCYRTVMLIESNGHGNEEKVEVDFDDKNSWEYLFKVYWLVLKGKLSLTQEELSNAKNPWKGSGVSTNNEESSDESYIANDEQETSSDSSLGHREGSISSRRKTRKRSRKSAASDNPTKHPAASDDPTKHSAASDNPTKHLDSELKTLSEDSGWASEELLKFVSHMKNGDVSVLTAFDVQALLLEYIKRYNLRDPRRKSQIICDSRLKNLFGKSRVGHFEMLKLLESHFLNKETPQVGINHYQGRSVDPDSGQMDADEYSNVMAYIGSDKKQKNRKKIEERDLQTNLDDYAAIDVHNINLIYLRRNLMEDLLDDMNAFGKKVVGSFVRKRISSAGQKQDMYRLVQVVGTHTVAEKYKVGKKTTDAALEILNLDRTEILPIDTISNQDFTEEECRRLRQSIKCGLVNRLTVGDLQDKARVFQAVRVNDWLESEKLRLSNLRDRASETGRRKELRECVEKLQFLSTPEERMRRLNEVPEIHVDPCMDPNYESPEEETDDKRADNNCRSKESLPRKRAKGLSSPGARGLVSRHSSNSAMRSSSTNWVSNRSSLTEVSQDKLDAFVDQTNGLSWDQGNNLAWASREPPKAQTEATNSHAGICGSGQLGSKPIESYTIANEAVVSSVSPVVWAPSSTSENDKVWHYQDPSGKTQGPFSIVQLRKWSTTGYFPPDLRIWLTSEKQEDSILLTDALEKFPGEELQHNNLPQLSNIVGALNTVGSNCDGGWRRNNNLTTEINQNGSHWNALQSGVSFTSAGNVLESVNTWATRSANYTGPKIDLINSHKGQIMFSPRGWDSLKDSNAFYGQLQGYSKPNSRLSAPFSGNLCHSPVYKGRGSQGENSEKWSRNLSPRNSWTSNRSRALGPSDQVSERQYSNLASRQNYQDFSAGYQKIQPPCNSRNQWDDPPSPTPQLSSGDQTSAHGPSTATSMSTAGVNSLCSDCDVTPIAELNAERTTEVLDPKEGASLGTSADGWCSVSDGNVLIISAPEDGRGSISSGSKIAADSLQNLEKVDVLGDPSESSELKRPSDSDATCISGKYSVLATSRENFASPEYATVLTGSSMNKNQFFESACPSPTPRCEVQELPFVQRIEPDACVTEAHETSMAESCGVDSSSVAFARDLLNLSSLFSTEVETVQANKSSTDDNEIDGSLAEMQNLASFLETEINQVSSTVMNDKLANFSSRISNGSEANELKPFSPLGSEASPGPNLVSDMHELLPALVQKHNPDGNELDPAASGCTMEQNQTEKPQPSILNLVDTKNSEWSLPSPTPACKPPHWDIGACSTSESSQKDTLVPSDGFMPSPSSKPIADSSTGCDGFVGTSQCQSEGRGPAHGMQSPGRRIEQGTGDSSWRGIAQESVKVAWGAPAAHQETNSKTSWETPRQGNMNGNTVWGTPELGNACEDAYWGANACCGVPVHGNANANANVSWGTWSQGNMNINDGLGSSALGNRTNTSSGWEAPSQGNSNSGWGKLTASETKESISWNTVGQQGNINANSGRGSALGSNASWDSSVGNLDNSGVYWRYNGERYQYRAHSEGGGGVGGGVGGGGGGGSSRPPGRGQVQRGVCKFYESGHCKKGASCNYIHP